MIILIDDERGFNHPHHADAIARTPAAGVELVRAVLDSGDRSQIWLDHDLGMDEQGTILEIWPVMDLIAERSADTRNITVVVHTQNSAAGRTMMTVLRRHRIPCSRVAAQEYLHVLPIDER